MNSLNSYFKRWSQNFDLSSDELISSYYLSSLIFLDLSFCNLSTVPDAIGELMHLERLNLEGNNFVSLPPSIGRLSSLAYLNLAHCSWLQSLPELQLCATSLSGGNYFKMISGSHNHRSGLYIFNCHLLEIAESHNLSLSWMMKLIENPCHFRCGLDIVVPGFTVPRWFYHQFAENTRLRITDYMTEFDNWLGFAFCVAFVENCPPTTSSSSHYSFSSQLPYPLYLSFESEQMEETFNMLLRLNLNMSDGSNTEHPWLIYISRPHCHFVTTGATVTFKAHPDVQLKTWGFRMVFEHDISSSFELETDEVRQQGYIHMNQVHERSELNVKESHLSNMGLIT
ncbi:hypothetical protein P8452_57481 [Trifolium repens]|nr:hypothetical protein P8452_57481 [Trifolium repens]